MEKETLFIAFSTQKGGVGKTAFTVLMSSYLHYVQDWKSQLWIATTRNTVLLKCASAIWNR